MHGCLLKQWNMLGLPIGAVAGIGALCACSAYNRVRTWHACLDVELVYGLVFSRAHRREADMSLE